MDIVFTIPSGACIGQGYRAKCRNYPPFLMFIGYGTHTCLKQIKSTLTLTCASYSELPSNKSTILPFDKFKENKAKGAVLLIWVKTVPTIEERKNKYGSYLILT